MDSGERRLAGRRPVVLREAGPGDTPAVARLYSELSPESFHSRFQVSQPAPELVARLASLPPAPRGAAVVAEADGEPGRLVGEARYVRIGEDVAEFGLAVLDAYQGVGLGRQLLGALVDQARAAGLQRLRAIVRLDNAAMLALLGSYRWVLAEATDGFSVACLEFSVVGGMPSWPADGAGRRVLVERRGWIDNDRVAGLRAAGFDVRQCTGPRRQSGRLCPLVTSGQCRIAAEADLIVPMLPGDDQDCAAVLAAHQRLWPDRLST